MNRVTTTALGSRNKRGTFKIASRADTNGVIRERQITLKVIDTGVRNDNLNVQFPTCAENTNRNLAPVRNEQALDHSVFSLTRRASGERKNRLIKLDRILVSNKYRFNDTGDLSFDLVHHLHGLDDAEYIAYFDTATHINKGWRSWGGRTIKRTHHGCSNNFAMGVFYGHHR